MLTRPHQPHCNPNVGPDHQQDMGSLVPDMAYAVDRGIALLALPYNLTSIDVRLLKICREMDGRTATQLVRLLPVDAARISRVVNALVEKGLLRRQRRRDDRRVVVLRLTLQGEEVIAEITRSIQEYFAELTDGLSEPEIHAFTAAAQRIIANYAEISHSIRV